MERFDQDPRPPSNCCRARGRSRRPPEGDPETVWACLDHDHPQRVQALFESLQQRLAERMDETFRAARAPYLPPEAAENVVSLRRQAPKRASEQDVSEWGGEDSNLRPADYEFDPVRADDQAEWAKRCPDQQFRVLITLQRFARF